MRVSIWREPLQWLATGSVLASGILLGAKGAEIFRHPHERGDLVVTILREQDRMIEAHISQASTLVNERGWPDDFIALQQWLVLEYARSKNPREMAKALETLAKSHSLSPRMQLSLTRWIDGLQGWASEAPLSEDGLFEAGRQHHFEASGYRKIGRHYDGVVYYLWSSALLSKYIQENPRSPQVPEALFYLGINYLRLKWGLPANVRADRLLNLCSEMFPDSIWAEQANDFWRKEMVHGT